MNIVTEDEIKYWKSKFLYFAEKVLKTLQENYPESRDEIRKKIMKFMQVMKQLSIHAPNYDYGDYHANGARSLVKLWAKLFRIGFKEGSNEDMMNLVIVTERLDVLHKVIFDFFIGDNKKEYNHEKQKQVSKDVIGLFSDGFICSVLRSHPYSLVQLNCTQRFFQGWNERAIPFALPKSSYIDRIKSILSIKSKAATLGQSYSSFEWRDIQNMLSGTETLEKVLRPIFVVWNAITFSQTECTVKETMVPRSYYLDLDVNGVNYVKQEPLIQSNVRYQFAQYKPGCQDQEYYGKMLIFLHGGAFVGPKPDVLEFLCIRRWAESLPGLGVINFDYSLGPFNRFPMQIQELLDFYTWIIDPNYSDDVMNTFGFIPKEIVIMGQSGGASISIALVVALNEIRNKFRCDGIKLPKGVISETGKVNVSYRLSTSHSLSMVEPLAPPQLLPVLIQSYAVMKKYDESTGKYEILTPYEQSLLPHTSLFEDEYDIVQDALLSPLDYGRYNEITETSLYVYGSEFDPVLDEAIELAKKWKGKVSIVVNQNFAHTSHLFGMIDSSAKLAESMLIGMIKDSFK